MNRTPTIRGLLTAERLPNDDLVSVCVLANGLSGGYDSGRYDPPAAVSPMSQHAILIKAAGNGTGNESSEIAIFAQCRTFWKIRIAVQYTNIDPDDGVDVAVLVEDATGVTQYDFSGNGEVFPTLHFDYPAWPCKDYALVWATVYNAGNMGTDALVTVNVDWENPIN